MALAAMGRGATFMVNSFQIPLHIIYSIAEWNANFKCGLAITKLYVCASVSECALLFSIRFYRVGSPTQNENAGKL